MKCYYCSVVEHHSSLQIIPWFIGQSYYDQYAEANVPHYTGNVGFTAVTWNRTVCRSNTTNMSSASRSTANDNPEVHTRKYGCVSQNSCHKIILHAVREEICTWFFVIGRKMSTADFEENSFLLYVETYAPYESKIRLFSIGLVNQFNCWPNFKIKQAVC